MSRLTRRRGRTTGPIPEHAGAPDEEPTIRLPRDEVRRGLGLRVPAQARRQVPEQEPKQEPRQSLAKQADQVADPQPGSGADPGPDSGPDSGPDPGPDPGSADVRRVPRQRGPEAIRTELDRRRRRRRWRRRWPVLAGVLLVALVAGAVWAVFWSSLLQARQVLVSGVPSQLAQRVQAVAAVPLGTPLARLDLGQIQRRVQAIPSVASALVTRTWPHTVTVEVRPRVAVAVLDRGGRLVALDRTGAVFGAYRHRPPGLPLVIASAGVSRRVLGEGGQVAGSLPAALAHKVVDIRVASLDAITLDLRGGRTVTWGDASQSVAKAEVLSVLLHHHARVIDVSVPGRPTTG